MGWYVGPSWKPPGKPAARLEISRPSEYSSRHDPFRLRSETTFLSPNAPSTLKAAASICDTRLAGSVSFVAGAPNGMAGIS